MRTIRPSVFIVGAPKAGTTALHAFLDRHPSVLMSKIKEPNYFSAEVLRSQNLYYQADRIESEEKYLSLFQTKGNETIAGEASVSYLYYTGIAERIAEFNPNARILIALRNPVQRAYSHYAMDYSLGLVNEKFDAIIRDGGKSDRLKPYYRQYVWLGNYTEQISRYLNVFSEDQVKIILQEDLKSNAGAVLQSLCTFLQIDPGPASEPLAEKNVSRSAKNPFIRNLYANRSLRKIARALGGEKLSEQIKKQFFKADSIPPAEAETLQLLKDYYKPGLGPLQDLIHRDLSSWN